MAVAINHEFWFSEFIRLEQELGGPDPHLATLGEMIKDEPVDERIWRVGCYASGYNVPTGEVIWQHWKSLAVLEDQQGFRDWITENWAGFGLRRERRAVRTPKKFSDCLISYAEWMHKDHGAWWFKSDFPTAWKHVNEVHGMGRYVLLKVCEALCRYCGGAFWQSDIRANGGHSPRAGLALLDSRLDGVDYNNNSWGEVSTAESIARQVRDATYLQLGREVDWFTFQVALCEYKKVYSGRQYPGRTHDTELRYYDATQKWWENTSAMLPARQAIFNPRVLGELNGWREAREELSRTLPDAGYLWSDLLYDYNSTEDIQNPAPW